jgi:hypothetical protein
VNITEVSYFQQQLIEASLHLNLKVCMMFMQKKEKTPWPVFASELYLPSDRCLSVKLLPTSADRELLHGQCARSLWP